MNNEEEVEFALKERDYRAIYRKQFDDEAYLITSIRYSENQSEIVEPETKSYRDEFLDVLDANGVDIHTPKDSDDGKWHFILPVTGA